MDTKDITLFESGDGGEMAIIANDLSLSETLYQQVYLALFGGNIEANSKVLNLPTEEQFGYWGNNLFYKEFPAQQFNSNTERTIISVALNSEGRLKIIQAIADDLQYLSELLQFKVEVFFPDRDKMRIIVSLKEKGNQEDKILQMVYNNAKNELIIEKII